MRRMLFSLAVCAVLSVPSLVMAQDIEIVASGPVSLASYPDIPKVQKELRGLYNRLLALKKQQRFAQAGFGPGYADGNKWMQDAMAFRDAVENAKVPASVKNAGFDLIALGTAYMEARRKGINSLQELDMHEETIYDRRAKLAEVIWMEVK